MPMRCFKALTIGTTLLSCTIMTPAFSIDQHNQMPHTNMAKPSESDIHRFFSALYLAHNLYITPQSYQKLLAHATQGMLTQLDPHSQYLEKKDLEALHTSVTGEFVGIGVEITAENGLIKIISPLTGSPAANAGLQPGDLIYQINHTFVKDISLMQAVNLIKGKAGTTVELGILRKSENKPLNFNVPRKKVKYRAISSKWLAPHYLYTRITQFQEGLRTQLIKQITRQRKKDSLHGIIIDLRNNPGGILTEASDLTGLFMTNKQLRKYNNITVSIRGRSKQDNHEFKTKGSNLLKGIPIAVLINGGSASAAEILAGAIQDYHRGIVVGTKSFGKGSVQTVIPVDEEHAMKLTTALYYTPSGREIQGKGINPDVVLKKLNIKEKKQDIPLITENSHHKSIGKHIKKQNKADKISQEANLAQTDSQLYETLSILRGIHIMKRG